MGTVFEAYGTVFTGETGPEKYGHCPFCGKQKFYLNADSGQWSCKAGDCLRSGNLYTFLNHVWDDAFDETRVAHYRRLAANRGLSVDTLERFELAYNGDQWLLPVRNMKGSLIQLRHFYLGRPPLNTKGLKSALFNAHTLHLPGDGRAVWLCEGEWDAMKLWEAIGDEVDIVAVPGANVWRDEWTGWLANRRVNVVYDADLAGKTGMDRVAEKLLEAGSSVRVISWPDDTPKGYDLRDFLTDGGSLEGLEAMLVQVTKLGKLRPSGESEAVEEGARAKPTTIPIRKVVEVFRKWLRMTSETEDALRICLAVALSNRIPGDPLWMFLVAPPGGCKTELLTSMADCDEVIVRSTLTPRSLVSGFRLPGDLDPSLIPLLDGKVFVLKDFTEVLSMPRTERDEVYAILRGAYDGTVEKTFGNGVNRIYESHFSMLAGVTYHVQADKTASLGERFLMYKMRELGGPEALMQAMRNSGHEGAMRSELRGVMKCYVESRLVDLDALPEVRADMVERFVVLAQLVALLRGEVSRDFRGENILYRPEPEVGTRLAKQLKKLATCLQLLDGGKVVGREAYRLAERVALDTCKGFELDIFQSVGAEGKTAQEIAESVGIPRTTLRESVENMVLLGVLRREKVKGDGGRRGAPEVQYSLTSVGQQYWDYLYSRESETRVAVSEQDLGLRIGAVRRERPKKRSRGLRKA
jgi:DNA-binding HxlR family transcriptional regulator